MTDVGTRLVNNIFEKLMVDDQWSIRRDRGFTWWAYRLAQHVEVSPPVHTDDGELCTVRIWTDVAARVDPNTNPPELLGLANMQETLSAVVWDRSAGAVMECCTAVLHEGNIGWLSNVLATAAVLQNTAAHSRAHAIAGVCGGEAAASNHPTSGERPEMDEILNVPEQVIARTGAEPSRFEGPPMQGLEGFLERMRFMGFADSTGSTCEVPYTGNRPVAVLMAAGISEPETSVVQLFADVAHPEFGNGVLTLMRLPVNPEPRRVATLANELNSVEAQGDSGAPLLGAWCPDPSDEDGKTLSFCSFLPNILAGPGMLENQILYQVARSKFAARYLAG